jgi:thymidylate synthase
MNTVHMQNTRTTAQQAVWKRILQEGKDPFLKENIVLYHLKGILKEFTHWYIIENAYKYENAETHLVIIINRDIAHLKDTTVDERNELFDSIVPWIESQTAYKGGSYIIRTGEPDFSGASVNHLHAHWIQPQKGTQVLARFGQTPINATYRDLLDTIVRKGKKISPTFHEGYALVYPAYTMRFNMQEGFPTVTEREVTEKMLSGALGECIGFLHGATTLKELEDYGCPPHWWEKWTDPSHIHTSDGVPKFDLPTQEGGHLGELSYGGIWARFPSIYGGTTNQWKNVLHHLQKSAGAFTHRVTNWHPDILTTTHKRKVVVAPCHGDVQVLLFPETKELVLHHTQRSGDCPTGVVLNMIEYAGIGTMLAHVLGYTFTEYVHHIINAHIYEMQLPYVEKLLQEPQRPFPKMELRFPLTGNVENDFFSIRPHHFYRTEYTSGPFMKIPTPL